MTAAPATSIKLTPGRRALGWAVHAYTASGAVLGLLTIVWIAQQRFRGAFILMALATLIDSTDGPLARQLDLRRLIPGFDGALLDNIVDYLNYVLTPAYLMLAAGLLPPNALGLAAACAVMLSSTYGFCRVEAKTSDHYFLGFPSYWNLVALYLFCFQAGYAFDLAIVFTLSVLVCTPIKFIYPNRTQPLRRLTLMLSAIWGVLVLFLLLGLPRPNHVVVWLSFSFISYYLCMSFALQVWMWRQVRRSP